MAKKEIDLASDVVSVQPVLSTTIYSVGDAIGAVMTATLTEENQGKSSLLSLTMIDKKNKVPSVDVLFYSQNPAASTITDNAALAITAGDHGSYFLGRISILTGDWKATTLVGTNITDVTKLAGSCGLKLKSTGGDGLIYIVLHCIAAPSGAYAAGAGDLTLRLGVDKD